MDSVDKMTRVIQFSCFLLLLLQLHSAFSDVFGCGYDNVGAVQLYNGKVVTKLEGYVIVCILYEDPMQGKSKPGSAGFCWNGTSTFNEGAAAAACRQAGYSKQAEYNSGEQFGYPYSVGEMYSISEIQCPDVKNYITDGETVLLRCAHANPFPGDYLTLCSPSELAAVRCLEEKITSPEYAYNGQIYIDSLPNVNEGAYVQINLDGDLLPICFDNSNNLNLPTVGRSICRQLGYTDVTISDTVATVEESWYLGSLLCDSASYSCFTGCFNHSNYSKVSTCDGGDKVGLKLLCGYNKLNAEVYGSGSRKLCEIDATNTTCTSDTGGHKTADAFLGVFVFISFIELVLLVIFLYIYLPCCQNLRDNNGFP